MDVTLLGMVTEVKPLHPEKALLPMDVTSSPITTVFIEEIPLNHEFISLQWSDT